MGADKQFEAEVSWDLGNEVKEYLYILSLTDDKIDDFGQDPTGHGRF